MEDKRPTRSNVNVMNLLQNNIPKIYSIGKTSAFCWSSFAKDHKQNVTIIDQEKHKIKQIYIWNLMTTGFLCKH